MLNVFVICGGDKRGAGGGGWAQRLMEAIYNDYVPAAGKLKRSFDLYLLVMKTQQKHNVKKVGKGSKVNGLSFA